MRKYLLILIVLAMHNNSFANPRISNLIVPISYFVDHIKELSMLKTNLNKYHQASLVGTSGIGKTQSVRIYVNENKNNYNLIWFFDCNLDLDQEFLALAKQINKTLKIGLSEDVLLAKKEVIYYLTSQDKWLLVFDNLKINNKKVKDLVDWENNGDVIFCSQDNELLPYTIEMTSFNNKDAIILANDILENKDQESAMFLADSFKGYPILIVQGAQLLNKIKGLDKEEYKKKINQSTDKIKLNITLAMHELGPSANKLLHKISLINNQSFSRRFLSFIADNPDALSDDIYQLSKFMLISNIDNNKNNPIFEMHDVIAQKVLELAGDNNNKFYLENIITKLTNFAPRSVVKAHLFREESTVRENLEVIEQNIAKYNIDINKTMGLNLQLITKYVNSLDLYNAQKLIDWFNKNEGENKFKLLLMNNDERAVYSEYLAIIGGYHRRFADYNRAVHYYIKAKEIFSNVKGYDAFKYNVFLCLGKSYLALGQVAEAEDNIKSSEQIFNNGLVDNTDIGLLYFAKARVLFMQGKYHESLEQTDSAINKFKENGIKHNDLYFTGPYMLKAEILNILQNYWESLMQLEQIYNMQQAYKKEDHEIFARIYTQMAKSELGLRKIDEALEHVVKAITIFLADERRNPKEADYSVDPDLAASYVVQGDILFASDDLKQAIEAYKKAQIIYFYLYRERTKNVAYVSYLYTQGAKASCKARDLYNYKTFGKPQVKEFGVDHPNTIAMFEYCKQHGMDLWAKEN